MHYVLGVDKNALDICYRGSGNVRENVYDNSDYWRLTATCTNHGSPNAIIFPFRLGWKLPLTSIVVDGDFRPRNQYVVIRPLPCNNSTVVLIRVTYGMHV